LLAAALMEAVQDVVSHVLPSSQYVVKSVVIPGLLRSRVKPETRALPVSSDTAALNDQDGVVPPLQGRSLMMNVVGPSPAVKIIYVAR